MYQGNHIYIAIDLKSFYASVECVKRGLDPLTTNLVVADASRTSKTICLAVSPALKSLGIPGRARLFEVVQKVKEENIRRKRAIHNRSFIGKSYFEEELRETPEMEIDYITAPPQMSEYMKFSTKIYDIYLRYVAPEDIHVYSIDEVFMDVTQYLQTYGLSAKALARKILHEVFFETGITATAGVAPNLYLCKVAMDIVAKHIPAEEHGEKIAELNEIDYRRKLWNHRPLTDFWRVGRGYSKKLEEYGLYTMGDIARCSIGKADEYYNEELLYKLFGINAELLIDHAWGWEPCTIKEIKAYRPMNNSLGSGQVLHCPYTNEKAKLIIREMADLLSLDLVQKHLVTDQLVLTVGYDIENLNSAQKRKQYRGAITTDHYGRQVPKHAHGTKNIGKYTSSTTLIVENMMKLYEEIVNPDLLIRRVSMTANHVINESERREEKTFEQLDLFTSYEEKQKSEQQERENEEKEKQLQRAVLGIKQKYGKNAILKGMNLEEGATTRERNNQIGGHKA